MKMKQFRALFEGFDDNDEVIISVIDAGGHDFDVEVIQGAEPAVYAHDAYDGTVKRGFRAVYLRTCGAPGAPNVGATIRALDAAKRALKGEVGK